MSTASESNFSSSEEEEIFLGGRSATVESSETESYNYSTEGESEYSSEESEEEEIYGKTKKKGTLKQKQKRANDSTNDSDDSEDSWMQRKQQVTTYNNLKQRKQQSKATSGIVSDEEESEESDEEESEDSEFKTPKKKIIPTGEIEFFQHPPGRLVDVIGDWNEEKNEFLVKWKGRSWRWSEWLPIGCEELIFARRKVDNFVKKVEEERGESDDQVSSTLETLRFNLMENWRVVERIVAQEATSEQGNFYLCKWRALGYSECTWEWEGDVRGFEGCQGIRLIDEFLSRQSYSSKKSNSGAQRVFHRYKTQPEYLPSDLSLRNYQLDGLNWLLYSWSRRVNVILADEMGLGKTIQSVCFLTALRVDYKCSGPTLLVVPLSTIDAWQREFGLWARDLLNVIVYTGDAGSRTTARKYEFPGGFDVLLTTYELVLKDQIHFSNIKWRLLMVDEGHRLKNSSSQLYDVLFSLVPTSGRVLITGTPLQNSLGELWCLLRFLMPEKFRDYEDFLQKYSVDHLSGESNTRLEELHGLIKPHILRRLKRDVEHSLPGKTEKIIRVDLTPLQKQLYRYVLTRNYRDLKRTQEAAGNRAVGGLLNILGELKKICNHPLLLGTGSPALAECSDAMNIAAAEESGKLLLLKRLLRRLKDEGHRVLIFSQSVKMLDVLASFVRSEGYAWQRLDGSTTSVSRHQAITAFNAPGSKDFVFLLSTRAGGLGINLATADTVIIYDSDWNPQNDLQAMARAHRIGQKKIVRIFRLVSAGSVEEEILERAKGKMVLDHLVIQQLKGGDGGAVGGSTRAPGMASDLQAILKFGAKSLFDSESRAVSASSIDLDAIFAEDPEASNGDPDDNDEFLGQFRLADLGSLPNWDEIIPEEERKRTEEAELKAQELAKEVELQEALLTAATGRRKNQRPVPKTATATKKNKFTEDEDDKLVLFPDCAAEDAHALVKEYESLTRFGLVSESGFDERLLTRLDDLIGQRIIEGESPPSHFRVVPGSSSPLHKASLTGLRDRVLGLKALQRSLQIFSNGKNNTGTPIDALTDEFEGYRHGLVGVKPPANWSIPSYSVQHDSALLVALVRFGYGNWQQIRQNLCETSSPAWAKLQGPQLTRRVDYLLKELLSKQQKKGVVQQDIKKGVQKSKSEKDELRIIEKFRRPFKPLRSVLLALESLKSSTGTDSSEVGSVLTDHLIRLGDFIESDGSLRGDRESWEFIGCFWPFQKGSTGPELMKLYKSLKDRGDDSKKA